MAMCKDVNADSYIGYFPVTFVSTRDGFNGNFALKRPETCSNMISEAAKYTEKLHKPCDGGLRSCHSMNIALREQYVYALDACDTIMYNELDEKSTEFNESFSNLG